MTYQKTRGNEAFFGGQGETCGGLDDPWAEQYTGGGEGGGDDGKYKKCVHFTKKKTKKADNNKCTFMVINEIDR